MRQAHKYILSRVNKMKKVTAPPNFTIIPEVERDFGKMVRLRQIRRNPTSNVPRTSKSRTRNFGERGLNIDQV
jgi:hypothetical protein